MTTGIPYSPLFTGKVDSKIYEWNKEHCPDKNCSRCRLLHESYWRLCHEKYIWGMCEDEGH